MLAYTRLFMDFKRLMHRYAAHGIPSSLVRPLLVASEKAAVIYMQ
jgi:hypothetical protein